MFCHDGFNCEKKNGSDMVVSQHVRSEGEEKRAGQNQTENSVFCLLKLGKLVSSVKQPIWSVYNSIPEQNHGFHHIFKNCIHLETSLKK